MLMPELAFGIMPSESFNSFEMTGKQLGLR